jgi:hypothetical protein
MLYTAAYNVPTLGYYDFFGQSQVILPKLNANCVYLLDSVSIGGNVGREDFLGSVVTVPRLILQKDAREGVFPLPMQIVDYAECRPVSTWFVPSNNNTAMTATLSGQCQQLPSMIGVANLVLSFSYHIYEVIDHKFIDEFKRGKYVV